MAGKYNQWLRKTLAERIRNNGGYYANRHIHFALSWDVPFYLEGFDDEEEAKDTLVEQEYFISVADLNLQLPDFEEVFAEAEPHLWGAAQERLVNDLKNDLKNDDGMHLANYGRGGKHVCLTEFEGVALSRDLADYVDPRGDSGYQHDFIRSNQWCRKLMGIMDELDACLTRENATRCGQYYAGDDLAFRLGSLD